MKLKPNKLRSLVVKGRKCIDKQLFEIGEGPGGKSIDKQLFEVKQELILSM